MKLPWGRIAGFSLLPVISAISPILILPVLVRTLGTQGWASIAIGMSVGGAAAIIVSYGWGVVGPSSVAAQSRLVAHGIYRASFLSRVLLGTLVCPVAFVVAVALDADGSDHTSAGLMAVATALGGLSPAWYFIGRGSPLGVALWDTLPRLGASLLSIPALIVAPVPDTYALVTTTIFLSSWIVVGLFLSRNADRAFTLKNEARTIAAALRTQTPLVLSGFVSGAYTSLSVAIVGLVNFSSVAPFAAADRLRQMGKQAEMAATNGLQSWTASARSGPQRSSHMKRALALMGGVGLTAGAGFALLLPLVGRLLFGDVLVVDLGTSTAMGLSLFLTALSMSTTYHVLAPTGMIRVIAVATTIGALVGAPAIAVGAAGAGPTGAALGVALAEAIVVAIELPYAIRAIRVAGQE